MQKIKHFKEFFLFKIQLPGAFSLLDNMELTFCLRLMNLYSTHNNYIKIISQMTIKKPINQYLII